MNSQLELKKTFSTFATGVAIASSGADNQKFGITVNSFSSVSLDPPLLSFCVGNSSSALERFLNCQFFSINILSEKQLNLANGFTKTDNQEKWQIEPFKLSENQTPIFTNSLSYFECKKHQIVKSGDHHIIVGQVTNHQFLNDLKPLTYFQGKYQNI